MVASWEGHLGVVDALLRADADPNLQDGVGYFNLNSAMKMHTLTYSLIRGEDSYVYVM